MTQALVYANDKGIYPASLQVLRSSGYCNVPDQDPWGNPYVLSPALLQGRKPGPGDEVYVYSRGPLGSGTVPRPFTSTTGPDGSVGYSSLYGEWSGNPAGVGGQRLVLVAGALVLLAGAAYAVARRNKGAPRPRPGPASRRAVTQRPWYSVSLLVRILPWILLFLALLGLLGGPLLW